MARSLWSSGPSCTALFHTAQMNSQIQLKSNSRRNTHKGHGEMHFHTKAMGRCIVPHSMHMGTLTKAMERCISTQHAHGNTHKGHALCLLAINRGISNCNLQLTLAWQQDYHSLSLLTPVLVAAGLCSVVAAVIPAVAPPCFQHSTAACKHGKMLDEWKSHSMEKSNHRLCRIVSMSERTQK